MYSRVLAALVVLLLAAGCAAYPEPRRAFTSEAEILAAYGEPERRWHNDDGTATLEYSTQPNGVVTMMYTVDQGGIVLHQENALSDENLARVERGMTKNEVARLLGRHRSVQTFVNSGEEVWDWNIRNDYPGIIATLFNVHFVDDKVARTSRSHIYPNDRDHFGRLWPHPFYDPFFPGYGWRYPLRSRWYHWPYYDPFYRPWYFY